jgi:hypothetical protein
MLKKRFLESSGIIILTSFHSRSRMTYLNSQIYGRFWSEPEKEKRKVLSQIARIYDPVGFAAAFLICAKIGMQQLWEMGYDWNEELPAETCQKWMELFKGPEKLNELTFPRCLTPMAAMGSLMLCVFSDALRKAFGACAYLRWLIGNRVTPLKSPRH